MQITKYITQFYNIIVLQDYENTQHEIKSKIKTKEK